MDKSQITDSTIARIAGNVASGIAQKMGNVASGIAQKVAMSTPIDAHKAIAKFSVQVARAIADETRQTSPVVGEVGQSIVIESLRMQIETLIKERDAAFEESRNVLSRFNRLKAAAEAAWEHLVINGDAASIRVCTLCKSTWALGEYSSHEESCPLTFIAEWHRNDVRRK